MSRSARAGIAALCLTGLMANAFLLAPALEYTERGQTDFMDLYAGGRLAFTGDLYVPARVLETEGRTEGRYSVTRLFMRLPCFALFYWPLAQLPYPLASALWEGLCAIGMIAFAVLWPARRRWHTALACCWSLPLLMTLAEGQDIGFVLLAIALAALLMRRKQPLAGGMVASLCLAKFHLFLLIPVWICARRQWRFAQGLVAGCSALAVLSFIVGGWDWPLRYLALLRDPANNPYGEVMPTLHSMFAGLPYAGLLEIAGVGALAFAVWMASQRNRGEWGLAAALAGGILAAPHAYMADGALAIPALLLMMKRATETWSRILGFYLLTPIPWMMLMTGLAMPVRLGLGALLIGLAIPSVEMRLSGAFFRHRQRA
jgi:hypothetical protein